MLNLSISYYLRPWQPGHGDPLTAKIHCTSKIRIKNIKKIKIKNSQIRIKKICCSSKIKIKISTNQEVKNMITNSKVHTRGRGLAKDHTFPTTKNWPLTSIFIYI